jgi:hypothetical protein
MVLRLSMEERVDELACPGCDRPFRRVYGTLTEDGQPAGAYSLDLHYGRDGRYAYLAMEAPDERGRPRGVVCRLWTQGDQFQVRLEDPPEDPYFRETFPNLLERSEALKHSLKETFFHFSDHICESDLRVKSHFGERDA